MAGASSDPAEGQWATERLSDRFGADRLLPAETVAVRTRARTFADDVLRPLAHELNTTPERRDGFRHGDGVDASISIHAA